MKIAICDDDAYQISTVEKFIAALPESYENISLHKYENGEALLNAYQGELTTKPFDIIYLDIEMNTTNGIEVANQIRKVDVNVIIIYISSHQRYVYECFDASPFRFLVKPLSLDNFLKVFELAYKKVSDVNRPFVFSCNGTNVRLFCNDIIFFESIKRKMVVCTTNKRFEFYAKVEETLKALDENVFLTPHKSFIVNMNYITEFSTQEIKLTNGVVIPISKHNKKAKETYFWFLERNLLI